MGLFTVIDKNFKSVRYAVWACNPEAALAVGREVFGHDDLCVMDARSADDPDLSRTMAFWEGFVTKLLTAERRIFQDELDSRRESSDIHVEKMLFSLREWVGNRIKSDLPEASEKMTDPDVFPEGFTIDMVEVRSIKDAVAVLLKYESAFLSKKDWLRTMAVTALAQQIESRGIAVYAESRIRSIVGDWPMSFRDASGEDEKTSEGPAPELDDREQFPAGFTVDAIRATSVSTAVAVLRKYQKKLYERSDRCQRLAISFIATSLEDRFLARNAHAQIDALVRRWLPKKLVQTEEAAEAVFQAPESKPMTEEISSKYERDGRPRDLERRAFVEWVAFGCDDFDDTPAMARAETREELLEKLAKRQGCKQALIENLLTNGDIQVRRRVVVTAYHYNENKDPSLDWVMDRSQ
jgi:hypothetical protein